MDWSPIIKELGGGVGAVALAAMGFLTWKSLNWWRESQNARIEDAQRHADAMREITRETVSAMEGTTAAVHALTREVNGNG